MRENKTKRITTKFLKHQISLEMCATNAHKTIYTSKLTLLIHYKKKCQKLVIFYDTAIVVKVSGRKKVTAKIQPLQLRQ